MPSLKTISQFALYIALAGTTALVAVFFVTYEKDGTNVPNPAVTETEVGPAPSVFRQDGSVRIIVDENTETPAGYTEAIRDNVYSAE